MSRALCMRGFVLLAASWRRPASVLLSLLLCARPITAQARLGSVELRAGAALGIASTYVGGTSSTDIGPLLTGQLGLVLSPGTDLTLDLAYQPFKAVNPVRAEAYTALYSLLGLQVGLGARHRTYLRPELGVVFRSWSGSNVWVPSDKGLVLGLAVGSEVALSAKLGLAAEGFVRVSGADELATLLWGVAVTLVPVGARPGPH